MGSTLNVFVCGGLRSMLDQLISNGRFAWKRIERDVHLLHLWDFIKSTSDLLLFQVVKHFQSRLSLCSLKAICFSMLQVENASSARRERLLYQDSARRKPYTFGFTKIWSNQKTTLTCSSLDSLFGM